MCVHTAKPSSSDAVVRAMLNLFASHGTAGQWAERREDPRQDPSARDGCLAALELASRVLVLVVGL